MSRMSAVVFSPSRSTAAAALRAALAAGLGSVQDVRDESSAQAAAAGSPHAPLVLDLREADAAARAAARRLRRRLPDARILALVAPGVAAPEECDAVLTEPFFLAEVVAWCARAGAAALPASQVEDLAAGLSHGIGNPLQALLLQLELLAADERLADVREPLASIEQAARRVQEVLSDVARAAERLPVCPRPTRLRELLAETQRELGSRGAALPERVRLRCEDRPLAVERPLLCGALADAWQVLLLAGGPADVLAVDAGPAGEDLLRIRVAASVPRLPADAGARLFTPLWARQALGLPAGLSLTGARAAFRRHGGELRVREQRGPRLVLEALLPCGADEG
jgi:signal transduction histidine kinase